MFSSQKRLESQGNLRRRNQQVQYRQVQYQRELMQYQRELEHSLIQVLDPQINWSATTFVLAVLNEALSVLFRSGSLVLELLGHYLERDTIQMLIEQYQEERGLQIAIRKALSDREVNEGLKQFYIDLLPTIREATASININISGPVQGFVVGSHNEIDEAFSGLLQ